MCLAHLFNRHSAYLVRRLLAYKETTEILAGVEPSFHQFSAVLQARDAAIFERTVASGALEARVLGFDEALSVVSTAVLAKVRNDRDALAYRDFFPTGRILESTRAPVSEASRIIERIKAAAAKYPGDGARGDDECFWSGRSGGARRIGGVQPSS